MDPYIFGDTLSFSLAPQALHLSRQLLHGLPGTLIILFKTPLKMNCNSFGYPNF